MKAMTSMTASLRHHHRLVAGSRRRHYDRRWCHRLCRWQKRAVAKCCSMLTVQRVQCPVAAVGLVAAAHGAILGTAAT